MTNEYLISYLTSERLIYTIIIVEINSYIDSFPNIPYLDTS